MSTHTLGREWTLKVDDEYQYLDGVRAYGLIIASGSELEEGKRVTVVEKTTLVIVAPEMLEELKLANKIIINALNVMTSEQKLAWDKLNTRDDLKDGLALTRNHARESVIAKAEGRS